MSYSYIVSFKDGTGLKISPSYKPEKILVRGTGRLGEAIFLSKADFRTAWYEILMNNADARCDVSGYVRFKPDKYTEGSNAALFGTNLWYFGKRVAGFERIFSSIGWVIDLSYLYHPDRGGIAA